MQTPYLRSLIFGKLSFGPKFGLKVPKWCYKIYNLKWNFHVDFCLNLLYIMLDIFIGNLLHCNDFTVWMGEWNVYAQLRWYSWIMLTPKSSAQNTCFFYKHVKIWKQAGICLDNSIVLNNRAIVLPIVISKNLSLNMLIIAMPIKEHVPIAISIHL